MTSLPDALRCGIVEMVVRDAQNESVSHLLVVCGSRRTEQARGQIYVAVFSSPASQDDFGIVEMVVRDAQNESVSHLLVVCGSRRTEQARGQIYVAVFSSPASQDDFDGRRRFEQRRDCSTAGHPP